ncbi:uncharacterized protein LOC127290236 [Leptopilina boulardi]|uniref:uncharacterized protein LOC127290236 n=1 Tax=Leptopilina boulardi TaxID=63433 RepID=UPI0021F60ACC|nr:uncharacterized protein LOC127290236 [Leptopilina boulardi]
MDNMLYTNPIETVQFISIFSYFSALSDYLFLENHLAEDDQNKQIPVINALFEYLEVNRDNQTMKLRLVRKLLEGSDLYGEKNHENLDETFVNAMFEYIITSLVFDKYGNVYGFLAEVVRKTKNLQLDSLYEDIKANLRSAKFENEYGKSSILSRLAANRIFTDIILPLFPQPERNLNLLSLDYIYAQAGLIFLRTGKSNTAFYTDLQNINSTVFDHKNLFEGYMVTGHILRNALNNENIRFVSYKAFALPALFYYVSTQYTGNESIKDIVFDPNCWKVVYDGLFSHLDENFNKIMKTLNNDTKYQIHVALSEFKSYSAIAKSILESNCPHISKDEIKSNIQEYLTFPEHFYCGTDHVLSNLTEQVHYRINNISKTFKMHDLKIVQKSFGKSLLRILKYADLVIQLLAPDDKVILGRFGINTRIPYDLFVFYYPENGTADFYALMRGDYTAKLIKESDDPIGFQQKTGLNVQMLLRNRYHRINLKSVEQTMDVFWNNFLNYKQERLESYLKFVGTDVSLGEWWKEFGLSLVPFYPCITKPLNKENDEEVCVTNKTNFLHQWNEDKVNKLLAYYDTRSLLNSAGTTFKTVQVSLTVNKEYKIAEENKILNDVMKKLVLHMEEPGFDLTVLVEEDILLIQTIVNTLGHKINSSYTSVINNLNNMKKFKTDTFKSIISFEKVRNQYLFVKTEKVRSDTGYGYKFIYSSVNQTVQLRTDYQLKKQILVSLLKKSLQNENIYTEINMESLEPVEPKHLLYEINNQLQSNVTKVWFKGLFVHNYNTQRCDINKYLEHSIPLTDCPRHARAQKKERNLDEVITFILKKRANLIKQEILETMAKYTFPDEGRIDFQFVKNWTDTADFKVPEWGKFYIIDNPVLLSKLRYKFHLDSKNLSNFDGTLRIDSIYSFKERQKIENGVSIERIIQDFNDQDARYVATFEDYYAIQNFATNGYKRITGDTSEAKLMKTALYKLAIRQSDDPNEEFDLSLFKVESKPIGIIDKTACSGQINLKKFTYFSTSRESALKLATLPAYGFINVLYEIKFLTPYIRAKIIELHSTPEYKVILLPGSEFDIENCEQRNIEGLGSVHVIRLNYVHRNNDKYNWYKNIMKEISLIDS